MVRENGKYMSRKILVLSVIVVLGFAAFLVYLKRESDPDRLFANLIKQMQEENYEDLYEHSSNFLQVNAKNKEVFTERMRVALEMMKIADNELNFQRDTRHEQTLYEVTKNARDDKAGKNIWTVHKLGAGENQVDVVSSWDHNGIFPKLVDLTVYPKSEKQSMSALLGKLSR